MEITGVRDRPEAVTSHVVAAPSASKTKCSSCGFSNTIVVLRQCPTKTRALSASIAEGAPASLLSNVEEERGEELLFTPLLSY